MRIVIVGPGALGTIFAAALGHGGHDVSLLGRDSVWLRTIQADGLCLQSHHGNTARLTIDITADPAVVAAADAVILLVKTTDTRSASRLIAPHLPPGISILTLQNGLGNSKVIREEFGDRYRVLSGVTSQAGQRVPPNRVVHTGEGPTLIGYEYPADAPASSSLAQAIAAAGLPATTVPDVEHWIWRKAAVNAAINGLTALGGFPNGEIVARPDLLDAAETVAEEAAAVARELGIELGSMRGVIKETALATATNRSSMLQDLEAGRATEVEAIHGAIAAAGAGVGIATPAIDLLAALIRAKTNMRNTEECIGG